MSEAPVTAAALIDNHAGLHARPCIKLTKVAKSSPAQVEISLAPEGPWVNAKSPVKVMAFRAPRGASLYFRASGHGARDVVEELLALVGRRFDEEDECGDGNNGSDAGEDHAAT